MSTRRAIFSGVAALALGALASRCGPSFTPASQVEGLRVLGMRAVPAEPRPGQPVSLEALVVDPSRPDASVTVLWFGCDPSVNPSFNTCSNQDVLQSLVTLSPDGGGTNAPGLNFLGFGPRVPAFVPSDVFAGVDAGDPLRTVGVLGQAIAIAIPAPPPTSLDGGFALLDKVRRGELAHVAALFRYPVSENPNPNHNPDLRSYIVAGETLPPGATVRLGVPDAGLDLDVDPASFEKYVEVTPNGPIDRTEALAASYFTTVGNLKDLATLVQGPVMETLDADGADAGSTGQIWTVVRDTRGGQSWINAPVLVCDPASPDPSASGLSSDGGLFVSGAELDSLVDLQVGPAIAPRLACGSTSCTAALPKLDAGDYPVKLRARNCRNVLTGLTVHVD